MKLKYEMEIVEIDGSVMGVPIENGDAFRGVLHMNGTTQDILEILKNDVSEEGIVSAMKQQYDAQEEDIRRNVQKVLEILREYRLLEEYASITASTARYQLL